MWMSWILHMYRKKNKIKDKIQDKYAMKGFIVTASNVASGQ